MCDVIIYFLVTGIQSRLLRAETSLESLEPKHFTTDVLIYHQILFAPNSFITCSTNAEVDIKAFFLCWTIKKEHKLLKPVVFLYKFHILYARYDLLFICVSIFWTKKYQNIVFYPDIKFFIFLVTATYYKDQIVSRAICLSAWTIK